MRPGIDYCALGHVHRFQDLNPDGSPPIVYPGTIERIDFGEEKDTKGFVIAEVEPGRARYQFFPWPAAPCHHSTGPQRGTRSHRGDQESDRAGSHRRGGGPPGLYLDR